MKRDGYSRVEVPQELEDAWTHMVNSSPTPFHDSSYFFGSNVPGKARRLLLNPGGRVKLDEGIAEVVDSDFKGFLS
jgi:hypothetical protein